MSHALQKHCLAADPSRQPAEFRSLVQPGTPKTNAIRSPYTLAINNVGGTYYLDLVVGSSAIYPIWTGVQSSEWSMNSIAGSNTPAPPPPGRAPPP